MIGKTVNYKKLIKRDFDTDDIISLMISADGLSDQFINDDAVRLLGEDVRETGYNVWKFVKDNIPYKEDPDGWQYVQLPSSLFSTRKGDCKSYSLACAAILRRLGISSSYVFISQKSDRDYHHVFVAVQDERGNEIWLDCVDDKFDNQTNYPKIRKITPENSKAMKKRKPAVGNKINVASGNKINVTSGGVQTEYGIYNVPEADKWRYGDLEVKECWGVPVVTQINPEFYSWLANYTKIPANNKKYADWTQFLLDFGKIKTLAVAAKKNVLEELKKDWQSAYIWSIFEPISVSLLVAKGDMKSNEYWENMYDKRAFEQLLYCYWNKYECAVPEKLQGKYRQALDYLTAALADKLNKRKTALFNTGEKYLDEFRMRVSCEKDCMDLYGLPVNMMLGRAYSVFNYGAGAVQYKGVPYFNKFHNTWVANGTSYEEMQLVFLCRPYGDWIGGMPTHRGTPYWSNGGWLIRNGATDKVYTEFLAKPKPKGLPAPLPYQILKKWDIKKEGVPSNYILPKVEPKFEYRGTDITGIFPDTITVPGSLQDIIRQLWKTPVTWEGSGVKSIAWNQGMNEQWFWDGFATKCRQNLGFYSYEETPFQSGINNHWFRINPTVVLNWFKAVNIHPQVYMNNGNGYQSHNLLDWREVWLSIGLFYQTIWLKGNFQPDYWEDDTQPPGILANLSAWGYGNDFSTVAATLDSELRTLPGKFVFPSLGATEDRTFNFTDNTDYSQMTIKMRWLDEHWSNFWYYKVMENGNPYEKLEKRLDVKPKMGSIGALPEGGLNQLMQAKANKFFAKLSGKAPGIGFAWAAVIPAILSFVIALIGIIMKALAKDENSVKNNMTTPPPDLASANTVIPTADGGYTRPAVDENGSLVMNPDGTQCWDKYDANNKLIEHCTDITKPENQPASTLGQFGGLMDGLGGSLLVPLLFVCGGALLLFGGGKKKGKKK